MTNNNTFNNQKDPVMAKFAEIYIKELAYQLYKLDWMRRISADMQMDALKDYYEECAKPGTSEGDIIFDMTFEEWLIDSNGYHGALYVSKEEFLEYEYQDKSYIKALLNNKDLYQIYLKDINE